MATGGSDRSVDSRVECSVCLEPYRGRQPKLLPCFHSFCLPCLSQLVYSGTQASFYVEDGEQLDSAPPSLCDLCDEGQVGSHYCGTCKNRSCKRCTRIHDKICQGTPTTASERPKGAAGGEDELLKKARDQLSVVEAVLTHLGAKKEELERERKAMEHSINVRFATGLGVMADARDECFVSFREAVRAERDSLEGEITAARAVQTRLSRLVRPEGLSQESASASQLQTAVVSEADFKRLQQQLAGGQGVGFFEHTTEEDNRESALNFQRGYMGKVVSRKHGTSQTGSGKSAAKTSTQNAQLSAGNGTADAQNETTEKLAELSGKFDCLMSKYTHCENLMSKLQTQNTSVRDANSKLAADFATIQGEHASLKDKCALLCQDVATLQAENNKLRDGNTTVCADLSSLRKNVDDLQQNTTTLQAGSEKMATDLDAVRTSVGSLQHTVGSAQTDTAKTNKSISSVQRESTQLREKLDAVEKKVTSLDKSAKDESMKIARLDSQISKQAAMVCFHASATDHITTDGEQTLILDNVSANVGDGYNPNTGVFTAPITGIYIFMATAAPVDDDSEPSHIYLLVDDEIHAVASAYNTDVGSCGTCHAAVQVSAGQKVWLESDDIPCSYSSSPHTFFSGVLVRAEAT
ncbi:hypothetical protein BaRGS_00009164 [Batillaria attramentaria]|uniref:C1q domain-containing protein n=1 Tax=Batillaria attramentaria TaxID=370345 RepID=A0ABD0LKK6_9CAEN